MTEAPQPGTAFQDFEKQLALVSLPAQGSLKGKEKETPPSGWPSSQAQASDKFETLSFVLVFMILTMIVYIFIFILFYYFFVIEGQTLVVYEASFSSLILVIFVNNIVSLKCMVFVFSHFLSFPPHRLLKTKVYWQNALSNLVKNISPCFLTKLFNKSYNIQEISQHLHNKQNVNILKYTNF